MYIKNSDLHNFADDNIIYYLSSLLNGLILELEKKEKYQHSDFRDKSRIANPEKFQAIIIDKNNQKNNL